MQYFIYCKGEKTKPIHNRLSLLTYDEKWTVAKV